MHDLFKNSKTSPYAFKYRPPFCICFVSMHNANSLITNAYDFPIDSVLSLYLCNDCDQILNYQDTGYESSEQLIILLSIFIFYKKGYISCILSNMFDIHLYLAYCLHRTCIFI